MEERVARLEENQKHNEIELSEVKNKVSTLESSYAVINLLSAQVEKLAVSVDKLNDRIEIMEHKDAERLEMEVIRNKNNKSQMWMSIIQAVATAFILIKLGLR